MRALMVRYNSNQWQPMIRRIELIKNSNYHSTIKTTPQIINNYEVDGENDDFINQIYENVKSNAKTRLNKYKETEFNVGDMVMVSMSVIYGNFRRKIKSGLKKELMVYYEPNVYTINDIIYPKTSLERKRYTLRLANTQQFLRSADSNEYTRVYASDLKICEVDEFDMTIEEALNLNGIEKLSSDLRVI